VTPSAPLRLDGYVRVSRVGGRSGDAFISPEVQRETVEAHAKARGHQIIAWHEDLDVSGGKLNRPGLDALMERIRSGETQGLAVAKLDRLSRAGVADALKLVEEVHAAGGQVVAVDLGLDPTTPVGELTLTVLLALARMERRRLSDSWEVAKARALDRGAKIGPTPFGYLRQADGTLALHPADADHVREAFARARDSVQDALDYLDENAPGRVWTTATVRRLLANRSYLGEQRYAGQVRPDSHPPIVSRAAWELAQHEPERRRRSAADFPLSGIASCATCGAPMVGGRGGRTRDGSGLRTYRCAASMKKYKGPKCPAPATMVATRLEGYVDGRLRTWAEDHGALVVAEPEAVDLAELERELEEAETELALFAQDTTARRLLGDAYHDALKVRADAVEAAQAALREAGQAQADELRAVSGLQRLAEATPEEWGSIVADVVERVEVKRGRGPVKGRVTIVLDETVAPELPELAPELVAVAPEVGELPPLTEADAPQAV
jgi:DNA invertase Pin-like site-specific DNA recombinase